MKTEQPKILSFLALERPLTSLGHSRVEALELLKKELNLATYGDLLTYYPIRHEDRTTSIDPTKQQKSGSYISSFGTLGPLRLQLVGKRKILSASFALTDTTIPLVWFNKLEALRDYLKAGNSYYLFGKTSLYKQKIVIIHPELTPPEKMSAENRGLRPIYRTTAKLTRFGLDSKGIQKLQRNLLQQVKEKVPENLPPHIVARHKLMPRDRALFQIHFPTDRQTLLAATYRIKFEELFFAQLKILQRAQALADKPTSYTFSDISLLRKFYENHLPFPLTQAQKRIVKIIYADLKKGIQMNRLLQGDVGSGKTMVAFLATLFPLAHHAQVAIMAPTELLAQQIAHTFTTYAAPLTISIGLLTGSTPQSTRKKLLTQLAKGQIDILIGTHALIEDKVQFAQLGLVIIDEQHRFGVAQRAKLWYKHHNQQKPPHLLVMTATPIPRTLAMTLYSYLDTSILDELPPGRKPVATYHIKDAQRLRLFAFLREKIMEGRQAYIVYPLIEESEKLDYKHLFDGYESLQRAFPQVPIGILHGRMNAHDKSYEMQRFLKGETKIMVATTVIEVGVNVPNATIIVIENAEKFGLAQLHQLRGRIKRSDKKGYCILATSDAINPKAYQRIQAMLHSDDGFAIAELDLKLRGGGNLVGREQSGFFKLNLANISDDAELVKITHQAVRQVLAQDPTLQDPKHHPIRDQLAYIAKHQEEWESTMSP